MDNKLIVSDENGNEYSINIIDIFTINEYPGKRYIAYTLEESEDEEYMKGYVSLLEESEDEFSLLTINDDNEWNLVQKKFDEIMKSIVIEK